jgi:hypothetical protein
MRRAIALLVMLAFAAATGAPAFAAGCVRSQQKKCCCPQAPANSICAPDCCDVIHASRALGDLPAQRRTVLLVGAPALGISFWSSNTSNSALSPTARLLVGLHERAAPRRPLRI